MLLTSQASIRENAHWLSLDVAASGGNGSDDAMENLLRELAKMNSESLNTAVNTMSFGTLGQLNVGAGVLMAATEGITKSAEAAKTVDMAAREAAMQLLEKMASSLDNIEVSSPENLIPFLSSSLFAMGSIMSGVNEILDGKSNSSVPPTDTDAAADWDYEPDIGDDIYSKIPLSDKAKQEKKCPSRTTRKKAKEQVTQMMSTVKKIGRAIESKSVEGETVVAQASGGQACWWPN
ncbi:hypothetical protein Pmani_036483 [Petrolisthes manimaculis]|uniref:Uncharacterized protein n=1 Tax=Petrolisthes manimaculis TaxID=1843537 RepID=A0AAE1TM28_9EUCA|nr:hypothetical protein Pmani_036483 [Petrolisthes manimaculis]